ncbi:MAG: hypothetical protein JRI36_09165 [Deltaproteobacteria bacterium]|nr:hypothetical protein [Deltaproteobacteria bacterium]
MEDLPRDVARDLRRSRERRKSKPSGAWTLLLVGDLGRIISFRVSKATLVGMLAAVVAVCAFSAAAMVFYVGARLENKALHKDLVSVNAALNLAIKAKEDAEVRLRLIAGKTRPGQTAASEKKASPQKKGTPAAAPRSKPSLVLAKAAPKAARPAAKADVRRHEQTQPKPQSAHPKKEKPAVSKARSAFVTAEAAAPRAAGEKHPAPGTTPNAKPAAASPGSRQSTETAEPEGQGSKTSVSAQDLLIENLEIWSQKDKKAIRFQFSLKNAGDPGKKIKGYTFVVLKPEASSSEPSRGSPWTPLKEGRPELYKRGQFFSIARFKYVRGTMPQIQDVTRFKTATIYVYTESGDLVLEKVYDLADVLRS